MSQQNNTSAKDFLVSSRSFFEDVVKHALKRRNVETFPLASKYLVDLLEFYVCTDNLYESDQATGKKTQQTLAEMYLTACNSPAPLRVELLKKLGDTSLYISGFFGDSLKRKVVDIDYYADIGGSAYSSLAGAVSEDTVAQIYKEFSRRFMVFVDVLTYISQQSLVQTDSDLLRLYDRYVTTGSQLARDQLLEKGLLPHVVKKSSQ